MIVNQIFSFTRVQPYYGPPREIYYERIFYFFGFRLTLAVLTSLLLQQSAAFAQDTSVYRLKNADSGMYLTREYSGRRDGERDVHLANLDSADDSFLWHLRDFEEGESQIIHVKTGLALQEYQNSAMVWGSDFDSDEQFWDIRGPMFKTLFVNSSTGMALAQTDGKWLGPTSEIGSASSVWELEHIDDDFDLFQLYLVSIRCIKPSTGKDGATDVLFAAVEFAVETGIAVGAGGSSAAATAGFKAAAKAVAKKALKSIASPMKTIKAKMKSLGPDGVAAMLAKKAIKKGAKATALSASNEIFDDDADTITELIFDQVYGTSPDDPRIDVNRNSVWPNGGTSHREISSQQTFELNVSFVFPRKNGLRIDLVEYDVANDDDSLGFVEFSPNELEDDYYTFRKRIAHQDEKSLYELVFAIERVGARERDRLDDLVEEAAIGRELKEQARWNALTPAQQAHELDLEAQAYARWSNLMDEVEKQDRCFDFEEFEHYYYYDPYNDAPYERDVYDQYELECG